MLTVNFICVGSLKEKHWKDACAEYQKRLSSFCKVNLIEIPEHRLPERPSEAEIKKGLKAEGEAILAKAGNSVVLPLCIEGKQLSSVAFSRFLDELMTAGTSTVSFIIGGSFGLSNAVKDKGRKKLSLSGMTFPHQLARVMLLEQTYRAFMILNNGKYHK